MVSNRDWMDVHFFAEKLNEKYPQTDLISLSDETLKQMLLSLDEAKEMPALPEDESFFFALKSVWSVVQYGFDDSGEVPDAYI